MSLGVATGEQFVEGWQAGQEEAPWIMTFPGIAIAVTVLGFNLFGDGLREALEPRQRRIS